MEQLYRTKRGKSMKTLEKMLRSTKKVKKLSNENDKLLTKMLLKYPQFSIKKSNLCFNWQIIKGY